MKYTEITLEGGAKVFADLNEPKKCSKCHKTIWWATTKNAKSMPITKDNKGRWISHFTDCKYANQFRKQSGEGDVLDEIEIQRKREKW